MGTAKIKSDGFAISFVHSPYQLTKTPQLIKTLEIAGIDFIDENGDGPSVRMLKRQHRKGYWI